MHISHLSRCGSASASRSDPQSTPGSLSSLDLYSCLGAGESVQNAPGSRGGVFFYIYFNLFKDSRCLCLWFCRLEASLAPFDASPDNNDDSGSLNCTVPQPRHAGGPVPTRTAALRRRIKQVIVGVGAPSAHKRDGILVGAELYGIGSCF